jgi:1-acyl-sn-glycerol-3-phosphate acyltransferase
MRADVPERPSRRSLVLRAVLARVIAALARSARQGLEHIPREGPCLLVFNQTSIVDTPLVSVIVPRADVTGLVALDYRANPLYRLLVECGGGIWIRRRSPDRAALQAALSALERGWVVGISPEGRRSRTGGLVEARPGPAFLAKRSGAPVVPLALTGTDRLGPALCRLRRGTLGVRVGEPFRLPPFALGPHGPQLREATDAIMCRLAALLPPERRGVYAEHPGLAELVGVGPAAPLAKGA